MYAGYLLCVMRLERETRKNLAIRVAKTTGKFQEILARVTGLIGSHVLSHLVALLGFITDASYRTQGRLDAS